MLCSLACKAFRGQTSSPAFVPITEPQANPLPPSASTCASYLCSHCPLLAAHLGKLKDHLFPRRQNSWSLPQCFLWIFSLCHQWSHRTIINCVIIINLLRARAWSQAWLDSNPGLPFTLFVIWGKLLNHSEPQFHLSDEDTNSPTSQGYCKDLTEMMNS